MTPPASFSFLGIAVAIRGLLLFHTHFSPGHVSSCWRREPEPQIEPRRLHSDRGRWGLLDAAVAGVLGLRPASSLRGWGAGRGGPSLSGRRGWRSGGQGCCALTLLQGGFRGLRSWQRAPPLPGPPSCVRTPDTCGCRLTESVIKLRALRGQEARPQLLQVGPTC